MAVMTNGFGLVVPPGQMNEFMLWCGGTGFLPALAEAGAMLAMGELPALRKWCDTRALDLLISVGTGVGCHGMVSHRTLERF